MLRKAINNKWVLLFYRTCSLSVSLVIGLLTGILICLSKNIVFIISCKLANLNIIHQLSIFSK